jgi:hypothetical protein
MRPEDIAKNKDVAVRLLFGFKENLNPAWRVLQTGS